ncbi:hypothetical protein TRVL_05640 [Trypanosoma vivax]|nr:hypothetical protein TRVL_05640 [Trypanosoma vivax]
MACGCELAPCSPPQRSTNRVCPGNEAFSLQRVAPLLPRGVPTTVAARQNTTAAVQSGRRCRDRNRTLVQLISWRVTCRRFERLFLAPRHTGRGYTLPSAGLGLVASYYPVWSKQRDSQGPWAVVAICATRLSCSNSSRSGVCSTVNETERLIGGKVLCVRARLTAMW